MIAKRLLFIFSFIFTTCVASFAAFPVKPPVATTLSSAKTTESASALNTEKTTHKQSWVRHTLSDVQTAFNNLLAPVHRKSDTLGLLSLIFGIVGLIGISGGGVFLSIAAIVLGAMGLSRNQRFSLVGLILGIFGVVLFALLLAFFIALLGF